MNSTADLLIAHLGDGVYRIVRRSGRSALTGGFLPTPAIPAASRVRQVGQQQ